MVNIFPHPLTQCLLFYIQYFFLYRVHFITRRFCTTHKDEIAQYCSTLEQTALDYKKSGCFLAVGP